MTLRARGRRESGEGKTDARDTFVIADAARTIAECPAPSDLMPAAGCALPAQYGNQYSPGVPYESSNSR
jgi:hypothetical protein